MFTKLSIIIFITKLIYALDLNDIDGEYCDIEPEHCSEYPTESNVKKLIFYDVDQLGGFSLRLDVYTKFAVMLHEARGNGNHLDWHLVLPPWYRLPHWRYTTGPVPWSEFIDLDSLKSYVPVLELWEVFAKRSRRMLKIDRIYFLQRYLEPSEHGNVVDKWEINPKWDCDYDIAYWGYKNITAKEIVCVNFQGNISQLWKVAALYPKDEKIMFAHSDITLHHSYGSKSFWDCRKSMKFNQVLLKNAEEFMGQYLACHDLKCTSYIAVHWRRLGFELTAGHLSIARTIEIIDETMKNINTELDPPKIDYIYLATDADTMEYVALKNGLRNLNYYVFSYKPNNVYELKREGHFAIIDQIICSRAYHFIGTDGSMFTHRIQEEREILGFNINTTYNTFCPENVDCETNPKRTIVS